MEYKLTNFAFEIYAYIVKISCQHLFICNCIFFNFCKLNISIIYLINCLRFSRKNPRRNLITILRFNL